MMPFRIGADASCTDGACGQVSRIIVNPVTRSPGRSLISQSTPSTGMARGGLFLLTLWTLRRARSGPAAPRTSRPSGLDGRAAPRPALNGARRTPAGRYGTCQGNGVANYSAREH